MLTLLVFASGAEIQTFQQRFDHFDSILNLYFDQRLVYNLSYTGSGFPNATVVYILGFENLDPHDPFPASVHRIAENSHAAMLAIEPRCVVPSGPFLNLSSDTIYFCNIEEILADIANILHTFSCSQEATLIGGGIGGAIAAWFKIKYPQYANGVWASSAPILVRPYTPTVDAHLLEELARLSEPCRDATLIIMHNIEAAFTHGDIAYRNHLRSLFGIPDSVSDSTVLYEISEAFVLMYESQTSEKHLLTRFCDGHSTPNLDFFAQMFNQTLQLFDLDPIKFDPHSATENMSRDGFLRLERLRLYSRCTLFGQFHTYNPSAPFRSRLVNESYYSEICHSLFGFPVVSHDKQNILFGGLNASGSSTVFTYSAHDLQRDLMAVSGNESNEIYSRVIDGDSTASDLWAPSSFDSPSLIQVREWAVSLMENWTRGSPGDRCVNGDRILNKCKCISEWGGDDCDTPFIARSKFTVLSSIATVIPTLLIFFTSVIAWRTILPHEAARRGGALLVSHLSASNKDDEI
jgi:pimeloyl-ACP methyl ester carboxylesterase